MAVVLPFERHKNPISNISWEYMNIRHLYHFHRHSTSAQTNRKVGNECAIDQNMKLSCTRKSKLLQIPLLFYNVLGFFCWKVWEEDLMWYFERGRENVFYGKFFGCCNTADKKYNANGYVYVRLHELHWTERIKL